MKQHDDFLQFKESTVYKEEASIIDKSDKTDLYQQFLGTSFQLEVGEEQFLKYGIVYNPSERFVQTIAFEIISETLDSQTAEIKVSWGHFSTNIFIIKIQRDSLVHSCKSSFGGFATIYYLSDQHSSSAFKCMKFSKYSSKRQAIFSAIKEYFLTKIASALKVGPLLSNQFGFDIVLYNNCIQFSMEKCIKHNFAQEHYRKTSKENLLLLHKYHIIHFDMKPDNLMFSMSLNKLVFIDYGLSSIVNENFGERSFCGYKGTINYSSQEMLLCLQSQQKQWIDVYYNDCHGLKISLQQMKLLVKPAQFYNDQEERQHDEQINQQQWTNFCFIMKVKYFLMIQNVPKMYQIFRQNHAIITNTILIDIFQFFKVVQPSPSRIYLYQQIQSVLKDRFDLIEINQIMEGEAYKQSFDQAKRYFLHHEKYIVKNLSILLDQFHLFEDDNQNNLPLSVIAIIQILTTQNRVSKNAQMYFFMYARFISFTSNIYDASLEERVRVSNYCLNDVIRKTNIANNDIQTPLKTINFCILCILEEYVNMGNEYLSASFIKNRKETIYNLIQHIFIFGKTDQVRLISIMKQLLSKYFFKIEDQFQFAFKIRSYLQWTFQKYEETFPFDLKKYINTIEKLLYQIYDHLRKTVSEKQKYVLKLLHYLISTTANKDCKDIYEQFTNLKTDEFLIFSQHFNYQLVFYYELLSIERSYSKGNCKVNLLYKITNFRQKFKFFSWTLKLFYFYFIFFNYAMSSSIFLIVKQNLKFIEILSQFYSFDIYHFINAKNNMQSADAFNKIASKATMFIILKQPQLFEHLIYQFSDICFRPLKESSKDDLFKKQEIRSLLNKISDSWSSKVEEEYQASKDRQHICVSLQYFKSVLNIKSAYYQLRSIQQSTILEQISNLKNLKSQIKCPKCEWVIEMYLNQFITNHVIRYYSSSTMQHHEQQFLDAYKRVKEINNLYQNQSLNSLFDVNNRYLFALFCISNWSYQVKYEGVKQLYLHHKELDLLHHYVSQATINRLLSVTLDVVFAISLQQFYYFASNLWLHIFNSYYRHYFGILMECTQKFVIRTASFDYLMLQELIEKDNNDDKRYLIYFYQKITQSAIKSKLSFEKTKSNVIQLSKQYNLCSKQVRSYFSIYRIALLWHATYKHFKPKKHQRIFKKAVKFKIIHNQQNLSQIFGIFKKKNKLPFEDKKYVLLKEKLTMVGGVFYRNLRHVQKHILHES